IDRGTVLDQNRQPVGDPLGIEGAVATSLGFTPMSVSKERQFKTQEYRATKRMSDEYEMTTRNVADLLRRFQETGDPELLLSANEMYNKYLTSVNGLQDRGAMVGSIANQLAQSRGKVTEPASLKMSETRQNLETAFPSVTPRYQSGLSSLQDQLDVAQLLGQDDVLLRKLLSLPSSALDSVLIDLLVQEGFRPEEASLLLSPGRLEGLGPFAPVEQ